MKKSLIFAVAVFACLTAAGQKTIGDFTLTNVADGKPVTLSEFSTPVVVIFTANECAFDKFYVDRIRLLTAGLTGRVQFLLINSGPEPTESPEAMAKVYESRKLMMPYLADKDQAVMGIFGAKKTPEAFVLKKSGSSFTIAYHGPIDDNPQIAADVKKNYLRDNIGKVLNSERIDEGVVRMQAGCSIRKK